MATGLAAPPLRAAGPIETSPYAVQGILVDEHDASAKAAKDKALLQVQMQALTELGENLGGDAVSLELARLEPKQVLPMLRSISIEDETISPGRYQARITVRFLPEMLKPLLANLGVKLPEEQGPPMMVIPVWTNEAGQLQVWEDNPWRKAWVNLHAAQAAVPILVPLGDPTDQSTLMAADLTANNIVKLEAMRRRYDVKTMLIAYAQPAPGGGLHAHVVGDSPLGKITIDKIYTADSHALGDSATLAAQRFQTLITDKFRGDQSKLAAKAGPQQLALSVSFAGPSQWNGLRSRILATPGVVGLDVTSLDVGGAAAKLSYTGSVEDLTLSFQATGLKLVRNGAGWLVSPM